MNEHPQTSAEHGFDPRRCLFAWFALLFGYCFWRSNAGVTLVMARFLLLCSLYGVSFCYALRGRARFDALSLAVLVSAGLTALSLLLWSNEFLSFLAFVYVLMAYCYLVLAVTGNRIAPGWHNTVAADLWRSLFVLPFRSFSNLFSALAPGKGRGAARLLLKVLLGLGLAVLPSVLFFRLLSFDSGFTALTRSLFSFDLSDVFEQLLYVILGVPVAMYGFGLYASAIAGSRPNEEELAQKAAGRRVLSPITAAVAVLPLLVLYGIFFCSQWQYMTAAFSGTLPQGADYAGYAREGFFQLCTVAALNFVILLALQRYTRATRRERVLHLLSLLLVLFTLILLTTAAAKLVLYIRTYGLTLDRLYAAWFMLLLAVLFILVLVGQFSKGFQAVPACFAVTVALFLALCLAGPNRIIAHHNVERYLNGAQTIDVWSLTSLGDDAVPDLIRLEQVLSERGEGPKRFEIQNFLESRAAGLDHPFWNFSLSRQLARSALRQAGYLS